MVRECKAVTLGEAKQYAAALPADKRRTACGCYTCSAPACAACCFPTCLVNFCGGCLMYNPFMCACPDSGTPEWRSAAELSPCWPTARAYPTQPDPTALHDG